MWAAGLQRLGAGVIALGAGLLAPLLGATKAFADSGDMLDKMAGRTGVAVEQLSALQFAAEQSGSSLGTIEKALRRMATTLFDAERGSKESVDALAAIGLTADQLKGLAPDEQFLRMADGLSRIENASMKAALAQKLFGRSGTELLPLLNGGQKGVRALVDEAQRLGIVMSTDQASAAAKFTDAWNRIKRQFQQIVVTIGSAVAPMLLELFSNVKGFLRGVIDWVRQNEALVQTLALVGGGLVIAGTAIIGLAVALKVLAIGMGLVLGLFALIKGAIVLLVSPVGLVVAGLTGLAAWFLKSTEAGQKMLGVLSSGFASIKADALEAFGGIKDALAVGNMGLAMEILVAFLKLQWKKFVVYLTTNWAGFVDFFFQAIDSVKEAWNALKETFIVIGGFLKNSLDLRRQFRREDLERSDFRAAGRVEQIRRFHQPAAGQTPEETRPGIPHCDAQLRQCEGRHDRRRRRGRIPGSENTPRKSGSRPGRRPQGIQRPHSQSRESTRGRGSERKGRKAEARSAGSAGGESGRRNGIPQRRDIFRGRR